MRVLRLHDTVEDNDDICFEDLESIFGLDVRRTFAQCKTARLYPQFLMQATADSWPGAGFFAYFLPMPRYC